MYNTLKLLKPLVRDDLYKLTLNELACMYVEHPDSQILATCYSKIYKLAYSIKNRYWGLAEEDVASWCLECLDTALRTYEPTYCLTTYFSTIFSNKLRTETQKINMKKRKCILESINEVIDTGLEDTYNVLEMLLPRNLSQKEHEYCMLASEGYDNAYIAETLNCSRTTISNIRKSLRFKLNGLQYY